MRSQFLHRQFFGRHVDGDDVAGASLEGAEDQFVGLDGEAICGLLASGAYLITDGDFRQLTGLGVQELHAVRGVALEIGVCRNGNRGNFLFAADLQLEEKLVSIFFGHNTGDPSGCPFLTILVVLLRDVGGRHDDNAAKVGGARFESHQDAIPNSDISHRNSFGLLEILLAGGDALHNRRAGNFRRNRFTRVGLDDDFGGLGLQRRDAAYKLADLGNRGGGQQTGKKKDLHYCE